VVDVSERIDVLPDDCGRCLDDLVHLLPVCLLGCAIEAQLIIINTNNNFSFIIPHWGNS
jgi:hypothetical protein